MKIILTSSAWSEEHCFMQQGCYGSKGAGDIIEIDYIVGNNFRYKNRTWTHNFLYKIQVLQEDIDFNRIKGCFRLTDFEHHKLVMKLA